MAKVTFKLRTSTTNKSGKIYLIFQYGSNNRFRYSTGLKVENAKNWDTKRMRVKNVIEEKYKAEVNSQLNNLKTTIEDFYNDHVVNRKKSLNNELLKEISDSFFNKRVLRNQESSFIELLPYYDWFISNYKTKPLPTTGRPLGEGTAKTYRNSYNILKRFSDTEYNLYYDNITLNFYDDFINWLYDQEYSSNYIGTQVKVLKTILKSATDKKFNTNLDYTNRYFRKPVENVDNIYLSQDEIVKISNLDLSDFKQTKRNKNLTITRSMLEKARDLFIVGCSTGLRVSDYNNLCKENIFKNEDDNYYFRVVTKKNKKPVTIPINSIAKEILEKNDWLPPEKLPEQHINYCIKILGSLADIDELTSKTVTKGGKPNTITTPKYNLISNHTARRSFCTNAYLSGMPTSDIMAISGHSTEKVFYNYIKVNDLERAVKIGRHRFFQ